MTTPAGTTREPVRPAAALGIALWFGLVTGILEAVVLAVRSATGHLVHVSWHYPWMIPVADAALFLVPGVVLTLLVMAFPRMVRFRLVTFCCLAMALGAVFFLYPRVSVYALAVLAIGVAFQLSRVLDRHRAGVERLVRRTLPWLAGAVVVVAIVMLGYDRLRERREAARMPPASGPNVLLIILDTVRAANLGLYGYPRPTTPSLERFARRGVRFDRAFSAAPWTLPSHASLLTGEWPHRLAADWESPLEPGAYTLAEYFAARGYVTAGFVANVGYCAREFGLAQGFGHYQDFPLTPATFLASTSIGRQMDRSFLLRRLTRSDQHLVRVAAPTITGGFLHWLDRRGDRPFFAMLNYYDAHGPYLPPAPYDTLFNPAGRHANLSPLHRYLARPRRTLPDSAVIQREMAQYDGAIAYLDAQLGQLFQQLEARGLMDRTVILLTADHGEEFGEHGLFDHGNSLYRPSVEVPLVLVGPGVPAGASVDGPVSLRDVAHTLAALSAPGEHNPFPGASLARFWDGQGPGLSPALSEVSQGIRTAAWYPVTRGDMRALADDSLRYIQITDGTEELYRLADRWERHDLADSSSALLPDFRQRIATLVREAHP